MCGSRKYPYPPKGGLLEFQKGGGSQRPKFLKGKYEPKLEFPEGLGGGGSNQRTNIFVNILWNNLTIFITFVYIRFHTGQTVGDVGIIFPSVSLLPDILGYSYCMI